MAGRKDDQGPPSKTVRKSLMVDAEKLERARKVLNASSDAEVLRLALDHFLSHFEGPHGEEE
jgi:hypothetical protein